LPQVIEKISEERRGLILVTGTTGSGKSTTLAAMVDHINSTDDVNIITIEDPIEFLHRDKNLLFPRGNRYRYPFFAEALKHSLRQDPDVILVGEMRDLETIETALHASETGHLVMSTLHTIDAPETINRIISMFPPYHQKQVRMQLASVLKAIISMRLIPRKDSLGRVPAVEVMINTATIRECIIEKEKTHLINDYIEQGKSVYGSQSFDQALYDLYESGLVTFEEALRNVKRPDDFKLKVKGVSSSTDEWNTDGR